MVFTALTITPAGTDYIYNPIITITAGISGTTECQLPLLADDNLLNDKKSIKLHTIKCLVCGQCQHENIGLCIQYIR